MTEPFIHMFPAAYSERAGGWTISAMRSMSYGPAWGDPLPGMVMIPDDVAHLAIAGWFFDNEHDGARTYLLGTQHHGCIRNKPTQLVIFFTNAEDRAKFVADFEIVE